MIPKRISGLMRMTLILLTLLTAAAGCSDGFTGPEDGFPIRTETSRTVIPTTVATTTTRPETPPDTIAQAVVKELTAPAYAGRLAGTEGNEAAANHIASLMQGAGLRPIFGNSFFQTYRQTVFNPDAQGTRVVITTPEYRRTELTAGRDFITNPAFSPVSLFGLMDFEAITPGSSRSAPVVVSPGVDINAFSAPVVFRAVDFFRLTPQEFASGTKFQVQISGLMKDMLQMNGVSRVQVTSQAYRQEKQLRNVAAAIEGTGSQRNAIVLMAHFDHYGQQGDVLFPGALDNASGVGVLLSLADRIQSRLVREGVRLKSDIVFAAVNSGIYQYGTRTFPGSRALLETLKQKYEDLVLINVDRVGSPTAGPLNLAPLSPQSSILTDSLKPLLDAQDIPHQEKPAVPSDHHWFVAEGKAAVTLSQDLSQARMSILTDVAEKLDYRYLARLSAAVGEFVVTQGDTMFNRN